MDAEHRIYITANAGQTWARARPAPAGSAPRIRAALALNGLEDFWVAIDSAGDQFRSSAGGRRQ